MTSTPDVSTAATTTADDLLEAAHAAAYRFPKDFTGFTATLRTHAGEVGTVTVTGPRAITVELPTHATEADWDREEITSMVGHRWASSYAEGDGRWAKRLEANSAGETGQLVKILDDPFDSAYRIVDGAIAEVHRTMGDVRFTIAIADRVQTLDGRWLPSHFTVFHWKTADGEDARRLIRADQYRDEYVRVDDVYLPARRTVVSATDDGLITRACELVTHRMLGHV
jgi:hypothetical protein